MEYRVYNTGDQVWLSQRFGQRVTVKILTNDGMVWSEEEPTLRRLEGAERYIHLVTVFLIKVIRKVLS